MLTPRSHPLDGERCGLTLKSIFEKAKNPDKVVVGLAEQNAAEDKFCLEEYCNTFGIKTVKREEIRADMTKVEASMKEREKCPRYNQVRLVAFHDINAKGPMYARAMVRKVLGNEEFCMQVDAHTEFVQDWDEILKEEWKKTENEFAIISTLPAAAAHKNQFEHGGDKAGMVPRQCQVTYRENGFPVSNNHRGTKCARFI